MTSWLRLELRRRWRSLIVLTLLVALSAGTVLTAVAGARRGESAIDRLVERTQPAHAVVLPNEPGFDWNRVQALPEVSALSRFVVGGPYFDDVPDEVVSFPFDDQIWRTIERPVVLEGRLADPGRVDEAVITSGSRAASARTSATRSPCAWPLRRRSTSSGLPDCRHRRPVR